MIHCAMYNINNVQYYSKIKIKKGNWVFASNSNFQTPISLQPSVVWPQIFQIMDFDRSNNVWNIKGLTSSGCKGVGFWKF